MTNLLRLFKMREKLYMLIILLLLYQLAVAQSPYQKLINKGNYEKAFAKADKSVQKDCNSKVANFNIAELYYLYCQNLIIDLGYSKKKFNIDKAYYYANKTQQLQKDDTVLQNNLILLQQNICAFAFELTEQQNTEIAYNTFIEKYKSCKKEVDKAHNQIIEKAFFQAKSQNSISAYQSFIEEYANSPQAIIAQSLQNDLKLKVEQDRKTKQDKAKEFDDKFIKSSPLNDSKLDLHSKPLDKEKFIKLINDVRAKGCYCAGVYYPPVKPLNWNNLLEQAAQKHSDDMKAMNKMTHYGSLLHSHYERIKSAGYNCSSSGENIARGQFNEEEVIDAWLKSETHCKLIMSPNFTDMGAAITDYFWTLNFARP